MCYEYDDQFIIWLPDSFQIRPCPDMTMHIWYSSPIIVRFSATVWIKYFDLNIMYVYCVWNHMKLHHTDRYRIYNIYLLYCFAEIWKNKKTMSRSTCWKNSWVRISRPSPNIILQLNIFCVTRLMYLSCEGDSFSMTQRLIT